MILPTRPPAWANKISAVLQSFEQIHGQSMYPVAVKDIVRDISRHYFPDAPITRITGEEFGDGFEGVLHRVPNTKNDWGIVYNSAIKSSGRINFTLAHELGHYFLHRLDLEGGIIQCGRKDMFSWSSEHSVREAEANQFASYLLMPRNLFEKHIAAQKVTLALLQHISDQFNVSLTAATLKWLEFTDKRAMLVVGRDGFVDWVWSSEALRKSRVFLQPKKDTIELPAQSLAMICDPTADKLSGVVHEPNIWPFREPVEEMTLSVGTYDMTITLLLFPDTAPAYWQDENDDDVLMPTDQRSRRN